MQNNRKHIRTVSNERHKITKIKIQPSLKYGFMPFVIEKEVELGLNPNYNSDELYGKMRLKTSPSKISHHIRTFSRDTRNKFSNETFYSINYENLEFDKLKDTLPLSPNNSDIGTLIDVKPKTELQSRTTAPSYRSVMRNPLKNLLGLTAKQKNASPREQVVKSLSPQTSIQFIDKSHQVHKGLSPKREDSNNIKLQNVIQEKLKHLNKTTTGLEQAY